MSSAIKGEEKNSPQLRATTQIDIASQQLLLASVRAGMRR